MTRSATRALALVALAGGLTLPGCGDDDASGGTTGEPIAGADRPTIPTTEPTSTSTPTPTPTEEPAGAAPTESLHPCELVTSAERRQLGVGPGSEHEIGRSRACEWKASGRFALSVGIFDDLGARDLVSKSTPKSVQIGSHSARQGTGGLSACVFAVGVSETSRVDVISAANGNTPKACRIAKRAAVLIEPKLP